VQAIQHCKQALLVYEPDRHGPARAKCYDLLARAYGTRKEGSAEENEERCVEYWKSALMGYGRRVHAAQWARIQASLGFIYKKRAKGARTHNLSRAIRCFEKALRVYCPGMRPQGQGSCMASGAVVAPAGGSRALNASEAGAVRVDELTVTAMQVALAEAYYVRRSGNICENARKVLHHARQALRAYTAAEKRTGVSAASLAAGSPAGNGNAEDGGARDADTPHAPGNGTEGSGSEQAQEVELGSAVIKVELLVKLAWAHDVLSHGDGSRGQSLRAEKRPSRSRRHQECALKSYRLALALMPRREEEVGEGQQREERAECKRAGEGMGAGEGEGLAQDVAEEAEHRRVSCLYVYAQILERRRKGDRLTNLLGAVAAYREAEGGVKKTSLLEWAALQV
jgi:hypothetical protein